MGMLHPSSGGWEEEEEEVSKVRCCTFHLWRSDCIPTAGEERRGEERALPCVSRLPLLHAPATQTHAHADIWHLALFHWAQSKPPRGCSALAWQWGSRHVHTLPFALLTQQPNPGPPSDRGPRYFVLARPCLSSPELGQDHLFTWIIYTLAFP